MIAYAGTLSVVESDAVVDFVVVRIVDVSVVVEDVVAVDDEVVVPAAGGGLVAVLLDVALAVSVVVVPVFVGKSAVLSAVNLGNEVVAVVAHAVARAVVFPLAFQKVVDVVHAAALAVVGVARAFELDDVALLVVAVAVAMVVVAIVVFVVIVVVFLLVLKMEFVAEAVTLLADVVDVVVTVAVLVEAVVADVLTHAAVAGDGVVPE